MIRIQIQANICISYESLESFFPRQLPRQHSLLSLAAQPRQRFVDCASLLRHHRRCRRRRRLSHRKPPILFARKQVVVWGNGEGNRESAEAGEKSNEKYYREGQLSEG